MYLNLEESRSLAQFYLEKLNQLSDNIKTVVFPSNLAFSSVKDVLQNNQIDLGGQNCYWVDKGGYTGEVSAQMLSDAGAKYVLVGHSERRHQFGEKLEEVNKKMEAVLKAGLTPVLCIGETKKERDGGIAIDILDEQIKTAYENLDWPKDKEVIVAYEPVWSIGTGVIPSLQDVDIAQQEVKKLIGNLLDLEPVLLYGGSVRPENITEFLSDPFINGVLIGGSSTQKDSWENILKNI